MKVQQTGLAFFPESSKVKIKISGKFAGKSWLQDLAELEIDVSSVTMCYIEIEPVEEDRG